MEEKNCKWDSSKHGGKSCPAHQDGSTDGNKNNEIKTGANKEALQNERRKIVESNSKNAEQFLGRCMSDIHAVQKGFMSEMNMWGQDFEDTVEFAKLFAEKVGDKQALDELNQITGGNTEGFDNDYESDFNDEIDLSDLKGMGDEDYILEDLEYQGYDTKNIAKIELTEAGEYSGEDSGAYKITNKDGSSYLLGWNRWDSSSTLTPIDENGNELAQKEMNNQPQESADIKYLKEVLKNYEGNMPSQKDFEKEWQKSVGGKLTPEQQSYLNDIYRGSGLEKKPGGNLPPNDNKKVPGKKGYQHGNWYIINDGSNSYIKDIDSDWTFSGSFSTDEDAENHIKNHEDSIKQERFSHRENKMIDLINRAKDKNALDSVLQNASYEMMYSDKVYQALKKKEAELKGK